MLVTRAGAGAAVRFLGIACVGPQAGSLLLPLLVRIDAADHFIAIWHDCILLQVSRHNLTHLPGHWLCNRYTKLSALD
jgi:hypothetical protein